MSLENWYDLNNGHNEQKGELRHHYHHRTDIVPTILNCCGVKMPTVVEGVKQAPLPGVPPRHLDHSCGHPGSP